MTGMQSRNNFSADSYWGFTAQYGPKRCLALRSGGSRPSKDEKITLRHDGANQDLARVFNSVKQCLIPSLWVHQRFGITPLTTSICLQAGGRSKSWPIKAGGCHSLPVSLHLPPIITEATLYQIAYNENTIREDGTKMLFLLVGRPA